MMASGGNVSAHYTAEGGAPQAQPLGIEQEKPTSGHHDHHNGQRRTTAA